jgi:hypothetical protein
MGTSNIAWFALPLPQARPFRNAHLSPSLRGGEADEAIQGPVRAALDCFASLAMTMFGILKGSRKQERQHLTVLGRSG